MSEFSGPADETEAVATIRRALDLSVTLLDTADVHRPFTNEQLFGRAIWGRRDRVTLATKFGIVRGEDGARLGIRGDEVDLHRACAASPRRLGVDTTDLYYQHRVASATPIEETVGAMADLVTAGKVRFLGLSEAAPETIRRAHAVHPISALPTELSLSTRDAECRVLPAIRALGIGFVAYSPLGRGFLTGIIDRADSLAATDFRRTDPRFVPGNAEHNRRLVRELKVTRATPSRRPHKSRWRGCCAAGRTSSRSQAENAAPTGRQTPPRSPRRHASQTASTRCSRPALPPRPLRRQASAELRAHLTSANQRTDRVRTV
jgi:aryl-alcohol dehydrogenase-like predicted oxidoreductase